MNFIPQMSPIHSLNFFMFCYFNFMMMMTLIMHFILMFLYMKKNIL